MWAQDRLSDTLEEIVGMAIVDPDFAGALLEDPITAVRARRLNLTNLELSALDAQRAVDLPSFARGLMQSWGALSNRRSASIKPFPHIAMRPERLVSTLPLAVGGG